MSSCTREMPKKVNKFCRKNIGKNLKFSFEKEVADLDIMTGVGRTHIMMAEAIVK